MSKCKCDFRTKTVGDGCEICNPEKALEYTKEQLAERDALIADLNRQFKQREEDMERVLKELALTRKALELQKDVVQRAITLAHNAHKQTQGEMLTDERELYEAVLIMEQSLSQAQSGGGNEIHTLKR